MNDLRILGLLLLGALPKVFSQEVILSKSDLLIRVMEANTDLKISEAEYLQAQGEYRQTNAIFVPSISASHTGISTTNPLMAFGSKLNQAILTPADFNPNLLNDPAQTKNYATKIEVNQPVINLDGVYQRRAARFKMQASALQQERQKDYLILESNQAYMQLQLSYKGVAVLEKAQRASRENQKIAEHNFELGYLQKSDLLAINVRVSEVENLLRAAKSQIANASNYLSYLMNENQGITYLPQDSLLALPSISPAEFTLPESRADLRAMEHATEARKNIATSDKMAYLPRLNAFGSYELYDDQAFNFGASGYTVGAQLSWNILEGSQRFGKSQSSKAAYNQSILERDKYVSQSQMELERAKRAYIDATGKMKSTQMALEQTREALRIRTNRFEEGLEKTSDLLGAETNLAQKELEYYQTVFEHNYALAYLEFLVADSQTQNP